MADTNSSQILMSGSFKEGDGDAVEVVQPVPAKEEEEPPKHEQEEDKKEEPETTLEATKEENKAPTAKARRRATIHMEVASVAFEVDVPEEFADSAKRKTLMEDEEFLQAKGNDVKIYFPMRRINNHTCQCCGIMCGMWILSLVVLVVASLALGGIEFDIGVPFYDRSEINEEREDAYLATQRDADYVATIKSTADGSAVCINEAPTVMTRNGTLLEGPAVGENCQLASTQSMRILYISTDRESNILTTEKLEQIKKIEQEFLNHLDLTKYCHLIASNYSNGPFLGERKGGQGCVTFQAF